MSAASGSRLDGVLAGSNEPVFRALPLRVLEDMRSSRSESALLWNTIYPRAQPAISFASISSLPVLWGSGTTGAEDALLPYYWGYALDGTRLPQLDAALEAVDGESSRTEVDLFLVGDRELVVMEAKHMSGLGRCSRYGSGRCPEIHLGPEVNCEYWEQGSGRFTDRLRFGPRPEPDSMDPPCNRHYQLARTLMVGTELGRRLELELHLWLALPESRWRSLEPDWVDFARSVRDSELWKRMRAISWELIADGLPT